MNPKERTPILVSQAFAEMARAAARAKDRQVLMDSAVEIVSIYLQVNPRQAATMLSEPGVLDALDDDDGLIPGIKSMLQLAEQKLQAESEAIKNKEAAGRSNREFQDFTYAVSHDLNQQIGIVIGFLDLLKECDGLQLDETSEKYIQIVMDSAREMQSMLKDLLQVSRIETRGKPLQKVDSGLVIAEVLESLEDQIVKTAATIETQPAPMIMADPEQLAILFRCLLENALRFKSDAPPKIDISAKRENNFWRFSIADNGIGLEMRYAERIFVIFQRLNDREAYPGAGVGLAISKKIVERHGGTIQVDSQPAAGSTFSFTLPAAD